MQHRYSTGRYAILNGDCLEIMKGIKSKSVDMILADLPYETTQNVWDNMIDLDLLWKEYKRIIKDNGAIALFGQNPFSAKLVSSNYDMFRYEWIWNKKNVTGFLNSKRMPMKLHENILIFYKKLPTYNPQITQGEPYYTRNKGVSTNYRPFDTNYETINDGWRFPVDIIEFANGGKKYHPTQKPVALCEYLIKTYTNENELVLDNCMGGGTTGIACMNTDRKFIGIEMDEHFFGISKKRIEESANNLMTMLAEDGENVYDDCFMKG